MKPVREIALSAKDISKCFHIYNSPRQRLIQAICGNKVKLYKEFWALKGVSIEIRSGETVGIIGRNGSGKSTLLQIICGTMSATAGSVERKGRIGALLELGSGFNPEFTGIENIFLNAMLMGLSKEETKERLEDIVKFSEIEEEFLEQPIKNYSSGMVVRLAFAVQAKLEPEIMVVDEALAVGDEIFQRKCYRHLEQLKDKGCAILLVTHNCQLINQYCDRAVLMHKGELHTEGSAQTATAIYQQLAGADEEEWQETLKGFKKKKGAATYRLTRSEAEDSKPAASAIFYPSRGVIIKDMTFHEESNQSCAAIGFNQGFKIKITYAAKIDFEELGFGCQLSDVTGRRYTGQMYPANGTLSGPWRKGQIWEIIYSFKSGLLPGLYFVSAGVWTGQSQHQYIHRIVDYKTLRIVATDQVTRVGTCDLTNGEPTVRIVKAS
jgi:lipopolysaccharide transport system ATP-binding protein